MMTIPNNQKPVSHIYGSMRGVDLTSDYTKVEDYRSPCMVNFYRDYDDESGSLRTRPRMKYEGTLIPDSLTNATFTRVDPENNYAYWEYSLGGDNKLIKIGNCLFFVADKDRDLPILEDFNINNYYPGLEKTLLNPILIENSTDDPVKAVFLGYCPGFADEPPTFIDYAGKVYVYIHFSIRHDEDGRPTFSENGAYGTEICVLYFDKKTTYLMSSQFFSDYKKQKMIYAGNKMEWNSASRKFEMVPADFDTDEYAETMAPLIYTGCNREGGGTPNLPMNIFSNFVKIDYSFMTNLSFKTGGIGVPVDAISVKIQTTLPDQSEQQIFELEKKGKYWTSEEFQTAVTKVDDYIFTCTAIVETVSFAEERNEFVSVKKAFVFDERAFFAGLTRSYDKIRYSQAANPMYLPDTAWQIDGNGTGEIKDVLVFADYFAVLQDDIAPEKAIYLHTAQQTESEILTKIYPSTYSIGSLGVVNENCTINVNDCSLFLSYDGLKQIVSTDIKSTASIQHKSSMIDGELIPAIKANPDIVRLFKYKNYVGIFAGGNIYLGDTNALYSNNSTKNTEFEWFKWMGFSFKIRGTTDKTFYPYLIQENNNNLEIYYNYYGSQNRIGQIKYLFTHDATVASTGEVIYEDEIMYNQGECHSPVESFIATKYDNFGAYQYWKDCNRMWQSASVSFQLRGKPDISIPDVDIYEFTDPQNKFLDYSVLVSVTGQYTNPQIIINEGKPIKTLSDVYKRVSDSRIRYSLRSKRFEDLSIMFRFRSPVRFYYATAQAFIRGPVKR